MYQPTHFDQAPGYGLHMRTPAIQAVITEPTRCRIAYDALASEYEHPTHTTIADFHRLTKIAILDEALSLRDAIGPSLHGNWLVVGVGPGSNVQDLISCTDARPAELTALDISPNMLEQAKRSDVPFTKYVAADITDEAFDADKYDVVVALLCDPFLDLRGLIALKNLARLNAKLVISAPTKVWANRVRPVEFPDQSVFNISDGRSVVAPSYCWDISSLSQAGREIGLAPVFEYEIIVKAGDQLSAINLHALEVSPNEGLALIALAVFERHAQ